MLGELLGENTGRRIVRRILEANPMTVEVTFEDSGTILGVATTGFGTYTSVHLGCKGGRYRLWGRARRVDHIGRRNGFMEGLRAGKTWTGRHGQLPRDSVFSNTVAETGAVEYHARRVRIRG